MIRLKMLKNVVSYLLIYFSAYYLLTYLLFSVGHYRVDEKNSLFLV